MEGGIVSYIVIGVVVSIIVNFVLDQVKILIQIIRHRRSRIETADTLLAQLFQINTVPPEFPDRQEYIQRNRQEHMQTAHRRNRQPPDLPRRPGVRRMEPDSFPRCPIHRCCNRPGEPQKIFWDAGRKMWKCYKNHYFSS